MKIVLRRALAVLFLLVPMQLVGCGGSEPKSDSPSPQAGDSHEHPDHADHAEHDHQDGDHPQTLSAAVANLEELRAAIEKAFAADDMSEADGPVHQIGHALEAITSLAKKSSLSADEQKVMKEAVDVLFDSFGAIDQRIHGGKEAGKSYADVAEQVETAMTQLKGLGSQEEK